MNHSNNPVMQSNLGFSNRERQQRGETNECLMQPLQRCEFPCPTEPSSAIPFPPLMMNRSALLSPYMDPAAFSGPGLSTLAPGLVPQAYPFPAAGYPNPYIFACQAGQNPCLVAYRMPQQTVPRIVVTDPGRTLPNPFPSETIPDPVVSETCRETGGQLFARLAAPQDIIPPTAEASTRKQSAGHEEAAAKSAEGSEVSKKTGCGNAYKRRNVYKSIVQHMFTYIRKNKGEIIKVLINASFSMRDIEHAFFNVSSYNYRTQERHNKKSAQDIINSIIAGKNVYTYMMRESLNAMLRNLDSGRCGKITKENATTYRDTCQKYYGETVRILNQEAQGKTFAL